MSNKEQPNYYALIPASVRYDNNLKSAEKLLYGEITALANKNGYCYAQNKYFADLYNVTIVSISRWISHLQELGYIETEIIRNENKKIISRNIYIVDIPYYQKNQYSYIQKSKEGINKIVKDNNKYIESVAYDIQKETIFKNIIILVNDINRINLNDFAFGKNQILVIEDNEINKEKLKYLHSIRWKELVDKCFKKILI